MPSPAIGQRSLAKVLGPRPSSTNVQTHFRAQPSATMGSLKCSWQSAHLVLFLPTMLFHLAVREHHRLARDAVSQAVLDSSARLEVTLSFELRQAQRNDESTMQHRERDILLRLGNEAQDALGAAKDTHGVRATSTRPQSHNDHR